MSDSKLKINKFGDKRWRNSKNRLHRENGPALVWNNGSMRWFINNQLHRIDGPSLVYASGHKNWYLNDKFIRAFVYD